MILPENTEPPNSTEGSPSPGNEPTAASRGKKWYAIKVTAGQEENIKTAIERRIKIEGLEEFFGQIIIPMEKVTEMVKGKRITRKTKLYPGYIFAELEFNDKLHYLVRTTPGVIDFVGAGPQRAPQPLSEHEVQQIQGLRAETVDTRPPTTRIRFSRGDRVKIREGSFAGMEGEVSEILEQKGKVQVMLKIFGRDVPVEVESWQLEAV
ncbi:MAG: transcription termination/antitermination protein NusG [Gemmatales bacterium]|nr:transcription termination/antitermination protein NusG [Gemmatales bacterium]MCS7159499.1 transcription termination/antitermination protein NusG [Gemmatales bacterium]MDW8174698.1 transcription termination/antitermination protein NusG [Gemmatales bacterium]MDW8223597.1 transcription termination/antitermination protein NusG [Gemmatales bacterium]